MSRRRAPSLAMRALATLAVLLLAVAPASAHRLKVFASQIGDAIEGEAYFVGSGPAGGVAVTLRDAAGAVLRSGTTGADGRFALAAPGKGDITVVVDAQDGHVARFTVAGSLDAAPASEPVAGSAAVPAVAEPAGLTIAEIDRAVARRVAPLAEQIDALESSIRIRDVIGGLGYIAGLFGLMALLKSRRGRGAP